MRHQIELIAFDADDTLWTNMSFYHRSLDQIREIIGKHTDITSIPAELQAIETMNVSSFGYGTKSFIISMIETAIAVSEQRIQASEIQEIITIGKSLLNAPVELFEDAAHVVRTLSSCIELMLITKGDLFEQEAKILASGISDYFKYVEIVSEKDEHTYASLLHEYGKAPEHFLMVGNSPKSDVVPVLNIGGIAVHIPCDATWYHEELASGVAANGNYFSLRHISELPDFLAQQGIIGSIKHNNS